MLAQGKWTLAAMDSNGIGHYVDPYSILKVGTDIFQINVFYNGSEPVHVRAQTLEFDCANRKWTHVGWRHVSGFRPRKVIGKADRKNILVGSIVNEYAKHVCQYYTDIGYLIDARGFVTAPGSYAKLSVIGNSIYYDEKTKIARSIVALNGKSELFVECNGKRGSILEPNGKLTPFDPIDPILADWVCKPLHPSMIKASHSVQMPSTPVDALGNGSAPNEEADTGVNIDEAKQKCASLGFKRGTEKFGACVLRISK